MIHQGWENQMRRHIPPGSVSPISEQSTSVWSVAPGAFVMFIIKQPWQFYFKTYCNLSICPQLQLWSWPGRTTWQAWQPNWLNSLFHGLWKEVGTWCCFSHRYCLWIALNPKSPQCSHIPKSWCLHGNLWAGFFTALSRSKQMAEYKIQWLFCIFKPNSAKGNL
jgi:hypothetical protein